MVDTISRTSPRRILNILEEILIDPNNFTAKKISHKLKIPLPTVYRHIETLCEEKYIITAGTKKYLPGPKIRNIILKSLPYEPNFTLRRSFLRKLTNDIEETISLSIPIGTKLVYFDRIEFHWPMQLNLEAGDHLPLHASASGKLYLSTINDEDSIQIFKNNFDKVLEVQAHSRSIQRLKLSFDNTKLFSVGDDGVLACFTVTDKEPKTKNQT